MSITRRLDTPLDHRSDRIQLLDDDGHLLADADPPDVADETLLGIYETMRFARHFDERALKLQRQGRIATYAPMAGQEGAQVAAATALDDADWLFPTYRDHAAKAVHGVDPASLLRNMRGIGDGQAVPDDVNVAPEYIPIATQIPQATGAAWASKLRGDDAAVLCLLGDGATSEGDFHEGLNFAGVFDVPAVFLCNNNQWAISVPRERQTASDTLAQKARAYGFEGVQVDGMDPLAVYAVTRGALRKARDPAPDERRPTLIEAVQYRYGPHTTADDPSIYRDEGELARARERDPIDRMETFLRDRGLLDDDRVEAIGDRVRAWMATTIDRTESLADDPDAMFEHVYAEPTDRLREQRAELARLRGRHGDALRRDH